MRILTVRQPWAWAIIHGGKDVENRVQNIAGAYRGPVAIHAGLRDADAIDVFEMWLDSPQMEYPRGAIIGVVDLVDVHPVANPHFHPICHDITGPNDFGAASARGDGACSPWALPEGRWHMVLANPRPLAEPIPYRGALGLRNLAVHDPEMVLRIEAAIS